MNKREIYRDGIERGKMIASWIKIPEDGETICIDWGKITVSSDNWKDVYLTLCYESESINRDYSPFEFTAKEINDSHDPDSMWTEFERGIKRGFILELRTRTFEKNS